MTSDETIHHADAATPVSQHRIVGEIVTHWERWRSVRCPTCNAPAGVPCAELNSYDNHKGQVHRARRKLTNRKDHRD